MGKQNNLLEENIVVRHSSGQLKGNASQASLQRPISRFTPVSNQMQDLIQNLHSSRRCESGIFGSFPSAQGLSEHNGSCLSDVKIQKLQDQLEFKTEFMRMVIHDLRSPATSIQLSSELALKSLDQLMRQNLKESMQFTKKLLNKSEIKKHQFSND